DLLKKADAFRNYCVGREEVLECQSLRDVTQGIQVQAPEDKIGQFLSLEESFGNHYAGCDLGEIKSADSENSFWVKALTVVSETFANSLDLPGQEQVVVGDDSGPLHKTYRSFCFLRHFYVNDGAADNCLSIWAILHDNSRAFQARLTTAITQSGIDKNLPQRRLAVIRFSELPTGKVTETKLKTFEDSHGQWLHLSDDDLRVLYALYKVSLEFGGSQNLVNFFLDWVIFRRPIYAIKPLAEYLEWLLDLGPGALTPFEIPGHPFPPNAGRAIETVPAPEISQIPLAEAASPSPLEPQGPGEPVNPNGFIEPIASGVGETILDKTALSVKDASLGGKLPADAPLPKSGEVKPEAPRLLIGTVKSGYDNRELYLSSKDLVNQTVIFGGTGSGKTVLLRRIIEQASLGGTSAVIIDSTGDLCYLGKPWDKDVFEAMSPEEKERAQRYFSNTETIIWTPKASNGNPLISPVIPKIKTPINDDDVLEQIVEVIKDNLSSVKGIKIMDNIRTDGLISLVIRYICRNTTKDSFNIVDLIECLKDLPQDIVDDQGLQATQLAKKMFEELNAAVNVNPELKGKNATSIDDLFVSPSGKSRLSIVNLQAMESDTAKQTFVQGLLSDIFTWLTKRPRKTEANPLSYLVAIDEARDFVPSGKSNPSKQPILGLVNKVRKYGCGVILATQAVKSIDNGVVTNCKNQFFGSQKSATDIESCRNMGIIGVNELQTSEFFGLSESFSKNNTPVKFKAARCLSHHPTPPPSVSEIIEMARRDKERHKL
ncbi:MAG: DUF853 family protein, partial [Deltaproteobacteria bacterium]|nr:DUF853 family protein [Deltaproteobacteria bacterium]